MWNYEEWNKFVLRQDQILSDLTVLHGDFINICTSSTVRTGHIDRHYICLSRYFYKFVSCLLISEIVTISWEILRSLVLAKVKQSNETLRFILYNTFNVALILHSILHVRNSALSNKFSWISHKNFWIFRHHNKKNPQMKWHYIFSYRKKSRRCWGVGKSYNWRQNSYSPPTPIQ